MEFRPIFSTLLRNKTGALLIALQVAISLAILVNALYIVSVRLEVAARPSGVTDESTLFDLISQGGYHQRDCIPLRPPDGKSTAALKCTLIPQGPQSAGFWLYRDQAALNGAFDQIYRTDSPVTCPDGTDKPRSWYYASTPKELEGTLACRAHGRVVAAGSIFLIGPLRGILR